jgi:DNA-binding response OmpR family regulator
MDDPATLAAAPSTAPPEYKVLIVEDDIFLADLVCRKFREHATVFHASSTEQAREILTHETPELICLDIQLPGEDGITFLKKLRAEEKWKTVPVLIISNFSQESDIQKAKDAGATDYLVKANVELNEIVKKGEELIHNKK